MGDGSGSRWSRAEWVQQYDLLGKIGEGTYGLVFLARTKSPVGTPSKSIAIKKFKQSKDGDGVSPTAIREIMVTNSIPNLTFSFPLSTQFFIRSSLSLLLLQLLREITHENVVKLVNVHINHADMSLYLAFDYAEHDLYVGISFHREAFFFSVGCEINCCVKYGRKLLGITGTNSTIPLISTLLSLCSGSCSMD